MGSDTPTALAFTPDGHHTADRRSLAMHRAIAERLDESTLKKARARAQLWLREGGPVDPRWAQRWADLLGKPVDEVAAAICRDDPEMTQLRQTTPFAGALPNAERWRILREVR